MAISGPPAALEEWGDTPPGNLDTGTACPNFTEVLCIPGPEPGASFTLSHLTLTKAQEVWVSWFYRQEHSPDGRHNVDKIKVNVRAQVRYAVPFPSLLTLTAPEPRPIQGTLGTSQVVTITNVPNHRALLHQLLKFLSTKTGQGKEGSCCHCSRRQHCGGALIPELNLFWETVHLFKS